jgi:hypothetical protein
MAAATQEEVFRQIRYYFDERKNDRREGIFAVLSRHFSRKETSVDD